MSLALPSLMALNPTISRSLLLDQLASVLDFALATVKVLDRDAPFWSEDIDTYLKYADKAAIETALLLLITARICDLPQRHGQMLANIANQLIPLTRSERNQALLMRLPQSAAVFGIAHVALARLGKQDAVFDVLIRRAFKSGFVESVERVPYRAMDVRWLRGLLFSDQPLTFDDLLPHSVLTNLSHPIQMSPADIYALTHALMYLTDFASHPLPSSLDLDLIANTLDACIASNLLTENFDLLGELLLSLSILGRPWSPHARYAWNVLLVTWNELGFLPSPSFEISQFSSLEGRARTAYAHRHTYHTTFVAGILSALLLRHPVCQDAEPQWVPTPCVLGSITHECWRAVELASVFCGYDLNESANQELGGALDRKEVAIGENAPLTLGELSSSYVVSGIASRILSYPGICGRMDAPWARAVTASSLSNDEITMVLTDALLIQACRDYNLPVLAETLIAVSQATHLWSTTYKEAVQFLIRQQLPSGAIGAHFVVPQNCESPEAITVTRALAHCLYVVGNEVSSSSSTP